MREKNRLTAPLIPLAGMIVVLLIAAGPIRAQGGGPTQNHGHQHIVNHNNGRSDSGNQCRDTATQAWTKLTSDMDTMHVAMGSVQRSGDNDVDFVTLMLPHHQGAIDMAKTQLLHGKDPQMRRLAQQIIIGQQSEIELMQLWLKPRGALTSSGAQTQNHGHEHIGNHSDSRSDSGNRRGDTATQAWAELMTDMDRMHVAMGSVERSGHNDVDFVTLMLPHHQGAIDMAKTQLLRGKDPEMRRLAQEIITDQKSEIELMQLWLKQRDAVPFKNGPKSNSTQQGAKP